MATQLELAWLAGLFEGEGSFGIAKNPSGKKYLCIRILMTDEDVVKKVHRVAGFGSVMKQTPKIEHHKSHWRWKGLGKKAERLAMDMLPLLGKRRHERFLELMNEIAG